MTSVTLCERLYVQFRPHVYRVFFIAPKADGYMWSELSLLKYSLQPVTLLSPVISCEFLRSISLFLSHCVKNIQIRSFFWSVFSCTRTEYRKIQTRRKSIFGHFSRSQCLKWFELSTCTSYVHVNDLTVFWCFQGVEKGCIGNEWVKLLLTKWLLKASNTFERTSEVYLDTSTCSAIFYQCINPFAPNVPFLYPLKTSENCEVFWCFQGVEKACGGNEWVKQSLKDVRTSTLNKCKYLNPTNNT